MRGRRTEAAQAALDVMLTDAAVGGPSRLPRPGVAARLGAGLARHPDRAARRADGLGSELVRVATGRSEVLPAKRDRRVSDPAWESSWLFWRLLPTHVAVSGTVDGLVGGTSRFVLSTSGHIQALVNPPAQAGRASYRIADEHPETPEAWAQQAATRPGSWWSDYDAWLAERSGELKPAPRRLGGRGLQGARESPGNYVHAS